MTVLDFLETYETHPDVLSLRQASDVTGLPEYTLRKAIKNKSITYYSIGHKYYILKASLRGFVLSKLSVGEQDAALFEFLGQGDNNG